jgi:multiple sugar transport system permease protein
MNARKRHGAALLAEGKALLFMAPYLLLFTAFIIVPVVIAIYLSFTDFNALEAPRFIGLRNYIDIWTQDTVFLRNILPNTFIFSFIVGPAGYLLSFILAWALAQVTRRVRTVFTLILYSPSMTAGIAVAVIWAVFFNGDRAGYLNSILMSAGFIWEPIQWLQSPQYLMGIMIAVSLWNSMGIGFLAMLAGILNINQELYEAAYIDGLNGRLQEIYYITIPSMKPQMLFGAVMAVVGTFSAGSIGVMLTGANPTPQNAGSLIINHIEDFGFQRFEMGYAAALSVLLLILVYALSKFFFRFFREE